MNKTFTDNYGDTLEVYDFGESVYLENTPGTVMIELSYQNAVHLAEAILKAARKASKAA